MVSPQIARAAPVAATTPSLDNLFRPRSVVFIGASADPARLTGRPLRYLRRHGFEGEVFLVHPKHSEIDGVPAVRSVSEIPHPPDVAVIMLPAGLVPRIAEECGAAGVKHLVILSSGFEETVDGIERALALRDIAHRYGMGVVGPNSEGLWFLASRAILTFGSAANRDVLVDGKVAVLSQSGSIGASIMRRLNDSGLGAGAFVSVGNETVLEVSDYLEWITDHTDIRVVACFLEGLRGGHRFLAAAARARRKGVAVVALQSGTSDAGRAASASHTGKISSAADVYRSLFSQAGVIQVGSIQALAAAAAVLAGPRLAAETPGAASGLTVIGLSGGSRSIIADTAARVRVPLAVLDENTTSELATFIPDFGVVTNPVDPTGQVLSDAELFPRTIEALARDPHTEALLVQYANGGLALVERHLEALGRVSVDQGLPVLVSCLLDEVPADHPTIRALLAYGITYASDPVDAVERLQLLFAWRSAEATEGLVPRSAAIDPAVIGGWHDASAFTSRFGITPPGELVLEPGLDEAAVSARLAASGLPFPLVVKPSPDDVAHKSEGGLVHLSLASPADVCAAMHDIATKLPWCQRVVVQEQLTTEIELLVVLRQDDDFGPVMGIGLGGFFVELFAEMAWVALPASASQVIAALLATRLATVLGGYRGRPPVDIAIVAENLRQLGVGYAGLASPPQLIELNPLTVDTHNRIRVLDVMVEPGG
ncbi:MAG: acetate--CoA ligase family protein [Candidatus Dormibacteria bacterium]